MKNVGFYYLPNPPTTSAAHRTQSDISFHRLQAAPTNIMAEEKRANETTQAIKSAGMARVPPLVQHR